jgi:hypothetical protein
MRPGEGCGTEVVNSRVDSACEARGSGGCESGKALAVRFPEHEAASRLLKGRERNKREKPGIARCHPSRYGTLFFFRDSTPSVTDSVCKSECSTTREI